MASVVKDILNDIQVRLPHTYSNESLILWINSTLNKIYKDLPVQNEYSFYTIEGQALYFLPENCTIDMINAVTICTKAVDEIKPNNNYKFKELKSYLPNENMTVPGYYDGRVVLEGRVASQALMSIDNQTVKSTVSYDNIGFCKIGIFPTPKDKRQVKIYYIQKPKKILNEDDIIELEDDYIDLVKYNVMSTICLSGYNPDIELANEYILLYNNLIQKANESKNEKQQRYPIIRNLYSRKRRR